MPKTTATATEGTDFAIASFLPFPHVKLRFRREIFGNRCPKMGMVNAGDPFAGKSDDCAPTSEEPVGIRLTIEPTVSGRNDEMSPT
nr:hypothetical protein Iba_chr14bCG2300 [Ipomoea batatas]